MQHGQRSEDEYILRLKRKLWQALRQLPQGDECWVSFDPDPAGVGNRPDRFIHATSGERAGPADS
jgi:hypothetical protein